MQPLSKLVLSSLLAFILAGSTVYAAQDPEQAPQQQPAAQEQSGEQSPAAKPLQSAEQRPPAEPDNTDTSLRQNEPTSDTAQRQGLAFQRQEPSAERSNTSGISLGKIAISLAVVLLLVVVLGWLFKKLTMRLPGSQHVKVICSVPMGQRERLLVIEIQGKQRVLGVTPHSINMLFELENSLPETKLASDFHTQLQSFLKK